MNQHSLTQKLTMLTIKEAASLLGLSIDETTQLAASGQIRCFWLGCNGDMLRFIRSDVDAFLEANQTVKQTTGVGDSMADTFHQEKSSTAPSISTFPCDERPSDCRIEAVASNGVTGGKNGRPEISTNDSRS